MKQLVQLGHALMPPNAQLRVLNPHVGSSLRGSGACALPAQTGALQPASGADVASGSVSSFGYSGTIAHIVLQHASVAVTSAVVCSAVVPSAGLLLHRRRAFEWVVVPHPFLATQLPPSDGAASLFRSSVAGKLFELVADHVVQGRVIFPGAGYLELGRAATRAEALHGVFFLQPLAVEVPNLLIECAVTEDGRFEVCSLSLIHI